MRKRFAAAFALASSAVLVAYAVGNGDIRATPEVQLITITSSTGSGSGTATLQNTTGATSYSVLVGSDASCDPQLSFSVVGGNPVTIGPGASRTVNLTCPPRGAVAMRRCLYHATSNTNAPLADFMSVCLYGSAQTLTPQATSIAFGNVVVGESAMQTLTLTNNGGGTISRVFLQTSDLDGNFQFGAPCNPDAAFCDETLGAIGPSGTLPLQIKCTPQTPGAHTAQIYVGTDTFQLLAQPVTVTCMGTAASAPALGVNPTSVEVGAPIEVLSGDATITVHVTNSGGGTLLVTDVRTVDLDTGAALDWSYTASGECTGAITSPCSLDSGEQVDLAITFDPSQIGRRRATLLISYKDTVDRTEEIPLDGIGRGATLDSRGATSLVFGQVPVGRMSTLDFPLSNRGMRDITAQLSLANGTTPPFNLSPSTSAVVMPNIDRTISVTCAPTSAGQFSTTITAQAMDAFSGSPVTVSAACEGSSLALYSSPTAVSFGEIRRGGGSVKRTIQLLSTGSPVTLSGQPELENANASITLGALSQGTTPATFDVTITPSNLAEGQLVATVLVEDGDGETLRIPITGKIVVASYEVAASVDLGTFCVNQATTSSNLSLASDGTATIALTQPTLGMSPSAFQLANITPSSYPSTLPAGTTASVSITPQRQTSVAMLTDTLTWHTDVEGEQAAQTTVSARFIDQGAAIAPPALDFGKVVLHLFVEDGQRIVIQNCNPTPLQLDPPIIKPPFQIDSPTFPSMLNPNETATFSVGFHPTRLGVVTDTLRITSPQLPGAPLEVMLVGEGTVPEVPPDAGTSPPPGDTSFYACSCRSSRPGGVIPILLAFAYAMRPRRRGAQPKPE